MNACSGFVINFHFNPYCLINPGVDLVIAMEVEAFESKHIQRAKTETMLIYILSTDGGGLH